MRNASLYNFKHVLATLLCTTQASTLLRLRNNSALCVMQVYTTSIRLSNTHNKTHKQPLRNCEPDANFKTTQETLRYAQHRPLSCCDLGTTTLVRIASPKGPNTTYTQKRSLVHTQNRLSWVTKIRCEPRGWILVLTSPNFAIFQA